MGMDGTWIAFNGEIYNYCELAREHLRECFLSCYCLLFRTRISRKPRKGAFLLRFFPRNSVKSVASVSQRVFKKQSLRDVSLRTHTDTEVILHLYRKLGPRCVELLDGMFAFAILDGSGLFMARDPLGIKPIYCGEHDGAFYFASEVKALAEATNTI